MTELDPSARGSDVARSRAQLYARKVAGAVVRLLGLNRPGPLATEIVQQIQPVCTVETRKGTIQCRAGHGRLVWRAQTFYTEEPDTIRWLDQLSADDVLWDIGANVGMYSLYAAKVAGCRVVAFEPEAQNFALLMDNLALNGLGHLVTATNLAVTDRTAPGVFEVHAMTKGGAHNQFVSKAERVAGITQLAMGVSADELVSRFACPFPSCIKIDVDGNEPEIVSGAAQVLRDRRCRSVLIEVRSDLPDHAAIVDRMRVAGFSVAGRRSNWESRANRDREHEYPADNIIFERA